MRPSGDRPLHGKRVLITRPAEQSETLASALRAEGAQPLFAPTIEIRPLDDLSALDEAIDRLGDFAWLAFTSQNGVDVFMTHLAEHNETTDAIKIAAIGPQTADRVRNYGARVALTAKHHVSEGLAEELIALASRDERILLVCALEGREALAALLKGSGLDVTTVPAYRTDIVQDPAFAGKVRSVDVVTFTSASTVRGFSTLLSGQVPDAVRGKCVACIGPITAEAARHFGLHVDVIAARYTVSGLLDALAVHYGAG